MISALPVSGAWQPNTIGAHDDRPRISLSSESLSWPYPSPPSSGPRCVAHSFWRRTSAFSGSTTLRRVSSSGVNSSPGQIRSSGSTSSRTNSSAQSSLAWNSGSVSKSHIGASLRRSEYDSGYGERNFEEGDFRSGGRARRRRRRPIRRRRGGAHRAAHADPARGRLRRRGAAAARRGPRRDAPVRHDVPPAGGRHRGGRGPVERRLLPALPVEGRTGRRPARGRHRAAAQLPRPPDGEGGDARRAGAPLGRGRARPGGRRGHRRHHPGRAVERRQRGGGPAVRPTVREPPAGRAVAGAVHRAGQRAPRTRCRAGGPRGRGPPVRPPVGTVPPVLRDDRPRRRRVPRHRHGVGGRRGRRRRVSEDAPVSFHLFLPQMRMPLDAIVERAQAAESAGFEGIALMDHLAPPLAAGHDMWEAMTAATWLLARAGTLDHASGGRFELGIGSGSVPDELDAFGVGMPSARERVARLGETLDVLRGLWTGEPVTYDGAFFQLREAQQRPVPTRRIPIVVGGTGKRTLGLVRTHADWWNVPVHEIDRLDERRPLAGDTRVSVQTMVALVPSEAERDEVTAVAERRFGRAGTGMGPVIGTPAELSDHFAALRARGVERFYVWFADFAPPDTLERFAEVITSATTA